MSLAKRIAEQVRIALVANALAPIETACHRIPCEGAGCLDVAVLVMSALRDKAEHTARTSAARRNPFLPHEEEMFVCDASESHKLLLNKFPVRMGHFLVCTREFEPQSDPLNRRDLDAAAACLVALDALVFFNFGEFSGKSQPQCVCLQCTPRMTRAHVASSPGCTASHVLAYTTSLSSLLAWHGSWLYPPHRRIHHQ